MTTAAPVALVTGGARRVGAAMVRMLARRGYRIALHYNQSRSDAEALASQLRAGGALVDIHQRDLSEDGAPSALVAEVMERSARLDLLVNSAASFERTPFAEVSEQQWDEILKVNLRAPFFCAQAAAEVMSSGGLIVNIADLAAFETWPAYLPHSLAKGGIVQLTRSLAQMLAPRIRVNAISPGVVLLPEAFDQKTADTLVATTPLRRAGSPDDVVRALEYLIDATFVTGEILMVDGGRNVRR
jgi:pteridine reductase